MRRRRFKKAKSSPEIESPILARLSRGDGTETDFQLLERYGTAAAVDDLRRIYEPTRGRWACAPQTAMLRYFLRVDRDYGIAQVPDALGRRDVTGCYRAMFADPRGALAIAEIERLAIAALDDPSAEVARNAAEALGRHGSPAAEAPLWTRLGKFHQAWKDRYGALRPGPTLDPQRSEDGALEYALVHALAGGDAWIAGPEKLERLIAISSPGAAE